MKIFLTVLSTLLVLTLLFLGFIFSGIYNVAASKPDAPAIVWVLKTVRRNSIRPRAEEVIVPAYVKDIPTYAGLRRFHKTCEPCHGAPGVKPSGFAKGMYPRPPDLMKTVKDLSVEHIFWVIRNGIKTTAMPSFEKTLTDKELWALAVAVKHLPSTSHRKYEKAIKK